MVENIEKLSFDERLKCLPKANKQDLSRVHEKILKPRIVYVLSNPTVCGATKVIFEHVNRLVQEGYEMAIVSYGSQPTWYPLHAHYIKVPIGAKLSLLIPDCQLIVATYYTHIQECIETGIAPVVYFEQGDVHLFDFEHLEESQRAFVWQQYQLPSFFMTVSSSASRLIRMKFKMQACVIPNAIDHDVFKPRQQLYTPKPYLLMMGSGDVPFKGIHEILSVYQVLQSHDPQLDLFWVTPTPANTSYAKLVTKVFENPKQEELCELYQNAMLFISASRYESFSLPVLEAMACGCPVVSTYNCGSAEYGIEGQNLLFYESGNQKDLLSKIRELLENKLLRENLIAKGLETARKYHWKNSIGALKQYFNRLIQFEVTPKNKLEEWSIYIQMRDFLDESDYEKLIKIITNTAATKIYCPIMVNENENRDVRWQLVASREQIHELTKFCYCFLKTTSGEEMNLEEKEEAIFSRLNAQVKRLRGMSMKEVYDYAKELFENEVYEEALYFLNQYLLEDEIDEQMDAYSKINAYRMRYMATYLQDDLVGSRIACFAIFEQHLPCAQECCFLGQTFMDESRGEEAIFWYELALSFAEEAWLLEPYLQLVVCYYKKGELDKAYGYHQEVQLLMPENETVIYNNNFFSSLGY